MQEYSCDGIPCVKAVEYVDVIADIEVAPKYNDGIESDEEEKVGNRKYDYILFIFGCSAGTVIK